MKRIAILVETSLASGRQILAGISRYLKENPDISAFHPSGNLGALHSESLADWEGDGIIARISNETIAKHLIATGLPCIDVLGNVPNLPFPLVRNDDKAIGRMVAEYYLTKGFRHFAMIGMSNVNWSRHREDGFFEVSNPKTRYILHLRANESEQVNFVSSMKAIREWLPTLPKPVAVFVASDQFAPMLFEVAHQLRLKIPEEISVIGVDNDAPYCDLCRPALSSVSPNHEKVGYEAARLLHSAIETGQYEPKTIAVPPGLMHLRRSSSTLAVDDPALIKALNFIKENARQNPSINAIAQHSGLSRSVLQRRFKSILNRTVGETLLHEKLNIAMEMLRDSELSISQVAETSGFNSQEYMGLIFRKHLNQTPGQFRNQ